VLRRGEPLAAEEAAFLAEWVAAAGAPAAAQGPALTSFCVAAMRRLWLETDGRVRRAEYAGLWRERFGGEPPGAAPDAGAGAAAVRRNERLMRRRRPYDTPAACVHGRWFFAHDRLAQIGERLDELGWAESQS
jgi:hypothetical protein